MNRHIWCGVLLLSLSGIGCAARPSGEVKVAPVNFVHADEKVERPGYIILADRRIFATMAFLNAVGYDEEQRGFQMHPVRRRVRQAIAKNLETQPEKLATWRQYWLKRQIPPFACKSYALSLRADYPFRRVRPNEELGYPRAAAALRDFPDILNDFWQTAKLEEIWTEVKPDYMAAVRTYDPEKMKRQMAFLWDYLRMERRDPFVIVHIPDLLNRHLGAMGAGYGPYFYSVDNPGANNGRLNVHEYLHTIVNPLVKTQHARYAAKLNAYFQAGKDAPGVRTYREPVTFVFECLVSALDRRISARFRNDPAWTRLKERQVAYDTEQGLNLTQPFYDLLAAYEESGEPFDAFLPTMLDQLPAYGE